MKLTLQREQLLKPLQMVMGAVDHKQAMPILSNVLIRVTDNQLSVTGTDLEIEMIGQTALSNQQADVSLTLPARKLADICKALPDFAAIELYQEKDRVIVTSERSRFVMSTLPADDFPSTELSTENISFSIKQKELANLLRRTAFAMAQQDVRHYLNGTLFEINECQLKMVATDGHRLASNQTKISISPTQHAQVIVPYKAVMELMRLLKEPEQVATIYIGHHHIRVVSRDFIFTSKLIEGRFPDYQRVIPKLGDKIATIDRDVLKQALSRAAVLCNEKARGIRFELQNNTLQLFANNPEREAAEEAVDIDYRGTQFDIGFNVNYLLDVLNIVDSGPIRLTLIDTSRGMRIEEPAHAGHSIFVIMPMRM